MFRKIIGVVFLVVSVSAGADIGKVDGKVVRVLTDDSMFGQCMVLLTVAPSDLGLNCGTSKFVSLGCDGANGPKSAAAAKFGSAQLAFVTQQSVRVFVDDDPAKKIDGYCYGQRVDVFKN